MIFASFSESREGSEHPFGARQFIVWGYSWAK
jgi:hypothetical protein